MSVHNSAVKYFQRLWITSHMDFIYICIDSVCVECAIRHCLERKNQKARHTHDSIALISNDREREKKKTKRLELKHKINVHKLEH